MLPRSSDLGSQPLVCPVAFGSDLVGELIKLVEIDSGPEAEGVRNRSWWRVSPRPGLLAETRAKRPIDHIPERQTKLAGAPLQETDKSSSMVSVVRMRCHHDA
jgi:hypothetical protein